MHKPLAQALVIIAAAAVASDEPSSGRRLAARRGRRRPVKKETESSHGLKESAPQLGKRAAPDGKTRFMLLSTQRSGTHYVMHELRRHPDVYTYDEIFYRHHRRRSFGPTHMRQGIEMFFGARAYKDDVIDGRYGWAARLKSRELERPGRVVARCVEIKFTARLPPRHRRDACSIAPRAHGGVGSSPLDGASTAASTRHTG